MSYHLFLVMLGTASLFTMVNILWMLSSMSENKCTSLSAISVELTPENNGLDKVVINVADRIPSINVKKMIEREKKKQQLKMINDAREKREKDRLKELKKLRKEQAKTKRAAKKANEATSRIKKEDAQEHKPLRKMQNERAETKRAAKKANKATSLTEKEDTQELKSSSGLPKKSYSVAQLNELLSGRAKKKKNDDHPTKKKDTTTQKRNHFGVTQVSLDNFLEKVKKNKDDPRYISLLKRIQQRQQQQQQQQQRQPSFDDKLPRNFVKIDRLLGPRKPNNHRDIIGDVSFLLDFAIMGFPKCGTTSMMRYLNIPGSMTIPKENCELAGQSAYKLVKRLHVQTYRDVEDDVRKTTRRGLKCPELIYDLIEGVAPTKFGFRFNHREYFNKTKYIVGVRHPIRWFESFYNYRITEGHTMPETADLIGRCGRGDPYFDRTWGVCTGRSMFHYYLARFSKTALRVQERKLLTHPLFDRREAESLHLNKTLPEIPLKVRKFNTTIFLYDVQQLSDSNSTRTEQFGKDIAKFIGLRKEMKNTTVAKVIPEEHFRTANNTDGTGKIDICDEEHKFVRSVLREIGAKAAKWMMRYFLKSRDVFVSSEDHLKNILAEWKHDPCDIKVEKSLQ